MARAWVAMINRRLSARSTMTPAHSENSITGKNWANPRRPSMKADAVRRCMSQPWATLCIQVPVTEMSWPEKKSL